MPCAGGKNLTPVQQRERKRLMAERLDDLEKLLLSGRVRLKLTGNADKPAIFEGWDGEQQRGPWADACAYRALLAKGSSALRMSQARAQAAPAASDRMQRGGLR